MSFISQSQWNDLYKKLKKPYGDSVEYFTALVNFFKKRKAERILDLGCGAGKHLVYLAKRDFEVYGIDIAKEAVKIARKSLRENNLKANLRVGNIYQKLPYPEHYFDAIISLRVLNHGRITQIRKAIKEMERVLKPKGLIFVTLHRVLTRQKSRIRTINAMKVKMLDPKTYILLEGREKGVVHYIFNKKILKKEFKNFKLHKFWLQRGKQPWNRYYCLLGQLKNWT